MAEALATVDLTPAVIFSGDLPTPRGERNAAEYVQQVDARALRNGWTQAQTMQYVRSTLTGKAADWLRFCTRVELGYTQGAEVNASWALLRPLFCVEFNVSDQLRARSAAFLNPQRSGESAHEYVNRICSTMSALSAYDQAEAEIEFEGANWPEQATAAQRANITNSANRQCSRIMLRALGNIIRALLKDGFRDEHLRRAAAIRDRADMPLTQFIQEMKRDIAGATDARTPTEQRGRVAATDATDAPTDANNQDNAAGDKDIPANIDRINARGRGRGGRRPRGRGAPARQLADRTYDRASARQQPRSGDGRTKEVCTFCQRTGHLVDDCRTRQRFLRTGGASSAVTASATPAPRDPATQMPGNWFGPF